eukprot:6175659-Pleurochrysis_carterae.AAC.2
MQGGSPTQRSALLCRVPFACVDSPEGVAVADSGSAAAPLASSSEWCGGEPRRAARSAEG